MKTFLKPSFILMLIGIFFSCKKSPSINPCTDKGNTLIFGRFCGMCVTNCAVMYRLNDSCLQVDASNNYVLNTGITFNGTSMTATQFNLVKGLNNKIPTQLLTSTGGVIGQPDSHDQCGYYLETTVNGIKKVWLVDTDTIFQPSFLKPFLIEVDQAITLLQ